MLYCLDAGLRCVGVAGLWVPLVRRAGGEHERDDAAEPQCGVNELSLTVLHSEGFLSIKVSCLLTSFVRSFDRARASNVTDCPTRCNTVVPPFQPKVPVTESYFFLQ